MKFTRVIGRLAILSLVAAAFVCLTAIWGGSAQLSSPDPQLLEERGHRPSAPGIDYFPELVGEIMGVAIVAVGGRIVFRLRLSPASRSKGQLTLLGLHENGEWTELGD